MRPAVTHLLLALVPGPAHGYALMQAVEESGAPIRLGPGTLYESLHRMKQAGLIEEVATPETEDRRRRTWSVTLLGRRALQAELSRLDALVRTGRALRLLPAEPVS